MAQYAKIRRPAERPDVQVEVAEEAMQTYRFGEFELDTEAQELRLRGETVHLERRPMDLLSLLVRNHGRMVPRDEIIAALWPSNVIIDFDSGLNTLVRKVRQALEDCPEDPRFVVTVPRRGYRFAADVSEPPPLVANPVSSEKAPSMRARYAMAAMFVLVAVAGVASLFVQRPVEPAAEAGTRIAVLPFDNLSGDENLAYLASGLAEETSVSLSRMDLQGLSIVGGVSSRAAAATGDTAAKIGRRLDADYIVSSVLQVEKSQIRVTPKLIRVKDEKQLWSASFDRELTNVLGLQRDLSIAIAEQVRQRLSPDVAAMIDRRQTQSPAAYELYLKGRYAWTRFSPTSVPQALDYYQQAVRHDPAYALAWAGIGNALVTAPMTSDLQPAEITARALDALERAMEYGSDLSEVHHSWASWHLFVEWDYAAAEAASRIAVELDSNNAMAHMTLGLSLAMQDEHIEATDMMRRARHLDPFFPLIYANSANVALDAGDMDAAMEFTRQAIAMNQDFWVGYYYLGIIRSKLGDLEGAIQAYEQAERLSGGNSKPIGNRAVLLAGQGKDEEVRKILSSLESRSRSEYVPPHTFATIYAALGDTETAFAWLEKALDERDVHLIGIDRDSHFANLQKDPRFASLVERCRCGYQPVRAG